MGTNPKTPFSGSSRMIKDGKSQRAKAGRSLRSVLTVRTLKLWGQQKASGKTWLRIHETGRPASCWGSSAFLCAQLSCCPSLLSDLCARSPPRLTRRRQEGPPAPIDRDTLTHPHNDLLPGGQHTDPAPWDGLKQASESGGRRGGKH